jgi:hypothetical protein
MLDVGLHLGDRPFAFGASRNDFLDLLGLRQDLFDAMSAPAPTTPAR